MIGFLWQKFDGDAFLSRKENRNAIVEIKRELNQFTIYYSVIVTLNDKS